MVATNYPAVKVDTKLQAALWMDTFRNTQDELFETAVRMCLLSCKLPPSISDIKQAINEWHQEARLNTGASLPAARSRKNSPAAEKAFDMIRSGQAQEYMDSYHNKEVFEWIRTKLPELSDETIRRNYCEVAAAYESNARCHGCMWTYGNCDSAGYYMVPTMEHDGYIKNEMARCQKGAR